MPRTNLTYKEWLAKRGQTSNITRAQSWARSAGKPVPRRKNRPPTPTQVPGPRTPEYMGYAGAVDPSFGGTPFGIPADAGMVWTGRSNPDLAEIGRGGYTNLTPRKRPGGGWDVYGNLADPTPEWGKQYLRDLKTREAGHIKYADEQVSPWLANVLGSAQTVNQQAQTGLANLMASVNTQAANAGAGGPTPVGMTGAGSGAGQYQDIAGQQAATTQAGARIGGAAYDAALSNLTVGTSADQQRAGLAQARLRLPTTYEQMRMDFSRQLGQITESIKENQRAREFQRQQLLESRRQFGLEFKESARAARTSEALQREALGIEQNQLEIDAAEAASGQVQDQLDAAARTVPQIRSSLNKGEMLIDNKGRGFTDRPSIARYHGKAVQWEQAQDGRWYGVAGASGSDNAGPGNDAESQGDYLKRYRDYTGKIQGMFTGKLHPQTKGGKTTWIAQPGTKMSFMDVVTDMTGPQGFGTKQVWQAMTPYLNKMPPALRKTRRNQMARAIFQSMPGNDSQRILKMAKQLGVSAYTIRDFLGMPSGAG